MNMKIVDEITMEMVMQARAEQSTCLILEREFLGFGFAIDGNKEDFIINIYHDGSCRPEVICDAANTTPDAARKLAKSKMSALPSDAVAVGPGCRFDLVADIYLNRMERGLPKPLATATRKRCRGAIQSYILPSFSGLDLEEISRKDIIDWHSRLHKDRPAAADHAACLLSSILKCAEDIGARKISSDPLRVRFSRRKPIINK
jgi:hypothetical protein